MSQLSLRLNIIHCLEILQKFFQRKRQQIQKLCLYPQLKWLNGKDPIFNYKQHVFVIRLEAVLSASFRTLITATVNLLNTEILVKAEPTSSVADRTWWCASSIKKSIPRDYYCSCCFKMQLLIKEDF